MALFFALLAVAALIASPDGKDSAKSIPTTESPSPTAKGDKIHIPKDLEDCFAELKRLLPKEDVQAMRKGTEADMIQYHHGLGTWIRNNWGLWRGSALSKWFNKQGIQHPDDMSGIILDSFWRHLNSKPIKLDEQIKGYQEYWENVRAKRASKQEQPEPKELPPQREQQEPTPDPFAP